MSRKAPYLAVCACLLIFVMALATHGFGAFAATSGTVTACAKKSGRNKGALRLSSRCKSSERKVTWSQAGPAGPAGPAGQTGQTGPTGPPGQPGSSAAAPAGAVMFFDAATCPLGWSVYDAGRGRYLVGLPDGGAAGATVGTALTDHEDRPTGQHTHSVIDPGHSHSVPYDNEMVANVGNTIGGTQRVGVDSSTAATSVDFTGITIAPAGSVAGTNAPYVQLLVCRKD
jgi:hypothetical protein